nr:dihydrofolate reductase [uncultured bacterium]
MRKIVAGLFMSLDGVIEGPGPQDPFERAGWTMPYWSDDIGAYIGASSADSDALLLGRVTYQGFAEAFGAMTGPDADMMNGFRKYVVSNTLKQANWVNSTIISGDVIAEIKRLKQQPGKNINMSGSGTLVQSLLQNGLVDELGLLVYPVVVGMGKRLFPEGIAQSKLNLVEARPMASGVVLLRYQPA